MLRILITIVIALLLAIYGTAYALNTQAPYEAPKQVFEAEPVQDTTPTQKPVTKAEKPSDEPIWVENPQDCDLHTQWVYADGSCHDKAVEQVERVASPASTPQITGSKTDWLSAAGIPESQWTYVDYIITRESGWNPNAVNASSGACGLAQQLPCGKWSHTWNDPVGALIDANSYAISRYGSWSAAYNFWVANHWW